MNILIRADAGRLIGNGHLMRCLALGQILQDEGHKIFFATTSTDDYLIKRLKNEKFDVHNIDENILPDKDAERTIESANKLSVEWIVLDGYQFTTDYQKRIKNAGFKLICIDDLAKIHFVSDIIINQNVNADRLNYSCENYTKKIFGIKNIILRREFIRYDLSSKKSPERLNKILITVSNTQQELVSNIIKYFQNNVTEKIDLTVLTNSSSFPAKNLPDIQTNPLISIKYFEIKDDITEHIKENDLAIISMGITSLELLWCGLPYISFASNENQSFYAEAYKEMGIKVLGNINELSGVIKYLLKPENLSKYNTVFEKIRNEMDIINLKSALYE